MRGVREVCLGSHMRVRSAIGVPGAGRTLRRVERQVVNGSRHPLRAEVWAVSLADEPREPAAGGCDFELWRVRPPLPAGRRLHRRIVSMHTEHVRDLVRQGTDRHKRLRHVRPPMWNWLQLHVGKLLMWSWSHDLQPRVRGPHQGRLELRRLWIGLRGRDHVHI